MAGRLCIRWHMLPNALSLGRLLMVPVLGWIALEGEPSVFIGLVVAAWLSDLLDGWIARRFGWVSKAGALLDSIADIALIGITLFGIDAFHPAVFREHGVVLAAVLAVWASVHASALARYRRLASFHTPLARTGIVLYAIFVLVLFVVGFEGWLYYLCGAVCLLAGLENLALVWLVHDWTPDFKGGLIAAFGERRAKRA